MVTVTPGRTLFDSSLIVPSIVPDETLCARVAGGQTTEMSASRPATNPLDIPASLAATNRVMAVFRSAAGTAAVQPFPVARRTPGASRTAAIARRQPPDPRSRRVESLPERHRAH